MTIGAPHEGSFTGTGASSTTGKAVQGWFNVSIGGSFTGTVKLERSFDKGSTWEVCSKNADGDEAAWTAPASLTAYEPEAGARYRFNCTAFSSGPITYRLSQ